MCRLHLDHIDHLEAATARLDARIEHMMEPFQCWRDLLITVPGIGRHAAAAVISEIGVTVREFFPDDAHLASWTGCARATTSQLASAAPASPAMATRTCRPC